VTCHLLEIVTPYPMSASFSAVVGCISPKLYCATLNLIALGASSICDLRPPLPAHKLWLLWKDWLGEVNRGFQTALLRNVLQCCWHLSVSSLQPVHSMGLAAVA
jgi:hypothetical protein